MDDKCLCETNRVVILPCSGGSNCGQIANAVAVELTKEGLGNIYCLAGIGAHIDGMIESARSAQRLLVIDGCSVACARKTVEHVGLSMTDYIDIAAEGVEKNHDFDLNPKQIAEMVTRARALLQSPVVVRS